MEVGSGSSFYVPFSCGLAVSRITKVRKKKNGSGMEINCRLHRYITLILDVDVYCILCLHDLLENFKSFKLLRTASLLKLATCYVFGADLTCIPIFSFVQDLIAYIRRKLNHVTFLYGEL